MENPTAQDYLLASYDFALPEDQIAQYPAKNRGESRLMVVSKNNSEPPRHAMFANLADYLPSDCLLVANNSRVMHARLKGRRPSGGYAEFLLLTPPALMSIESSESASGRHSAIVNGLLRPAAKIRPRAILQFDNGITVEILAKGEFGQCQARLGWTGDINSALDNAGALPLPPYIKREAQKMDDLRYQTVYASNPGSVAAPTAGLHFTESLRQELVAKGHEWVELSLHVGYGTFSPARCEDIRGHAMHSEFVELSENAANAITRAKNDGKPIIAVGTTSLRALESIAKERGAIGPWADNVNIFIYPGYNFRVIDGLITNFHLPRSTLLMLVAALAGRQNILGAYADAVKAGYRFFSYGDAMLVA